MCQWLEYYHKEPVTLHSGERSRWLVRADRIFEHEDLRAAVLQHCSCRRGLKIGKCRLSRGRAYRYPCWRAANDRIRR